MLSKGTVWTGPKEEWKQNVPLGEIHTKEAKAIEASVACIYPAGRILRVQVGEN